MLKRRHQLPFATVSTKARKVMRLLFMYKQLHICRMECSNCCSFFVGCNIFPLETPFQCHKLASVAGLRVAVRCIMANESRLVAQRPTLHDVVTLYSSILSCTVNALGIRDTTSCCNDASVVQAFAASLCRRECKTWRACPINIISPSRRRKHCTTFLSYSM